MSETKRVVDGTANVAITVTAGRDPMRTMIKYDQRGDSALRLQMQWVNRA